MYITNLVIENFGIIQGEVVFDPSSLNLISGKNGSGKSTIFKALMLLFFNKTEKKLEEYINENVNMETGFSLSVGFEHDDEKYWIDYTFKKKGKTTSSNRRLYVGNPLPQNPNYLNSDAVEYLEQVLPHQLGMAGMIMMQGETDVIKARPSDRREHLKEVYSLDFTEEIESINADIDYYKKEQIPEVDKKLYAIESKEYGYKSVPVLPFSEQELDTKSNRLSELQAKKASISQAEQRIKELSESIDREEQQYSSNSEFIEKVDDQIRQAQTKVSELKRKKEDIDKAVSVEKLQAEKNDASHYEQQKTEVENKINAIKLKRLKPFDEKRLEQIREDRVKKESEIRNENERLTQIEQGQCPVCLKPLTDEEHQHFENKLDDLQRELENIKEQEQAIVEEKKEYEEEKERQEKLKEDKRRLKDELQRLEDRERQRRDDIDARIEHERERLKKERSEVDQSIEEYKQREIELSQEKEDRKVQNTEIRDRVEKLKSQKDQIEVEDIEQIVNQIYNLSSEIEQYQKIKSEIEWAESHNRQVDEEIKSDEKKKKQLQEQRDKLVLSLQNYEQAKAILQKEFPSFVISELVDGLQSGINDFISKVYYKDLNINIKESRNAISITYGKARQKDVAHLSGAEQQIVSLAYKDYLNRIMGLGCLILDEADAYYTEENAENLYEVMERMSEHYEQLFVISHHEKAKDKLTLKENASFIEFEDGKLSVAA